MQQDTLDILEVLPAGESMFHIKHSALIKYFSTQQNNYVWGQLAAVPNRARTLNQCLWQKLLGASLREASGF